MPRTPKTFRQQERRQHREFYKGSKHSRGYDSQWEKISLLKRGQNPICEICGSAPATQVDHIEPFRGLKDPLRTEWTNLQSVCGPCHSVKTITDNKKGHTEKRSGL